MCGIVAYIGPNQAYPVVINGLKRLEYRGYDSAGVAIFKDQIVTVKEKGKVAELEALCAQTDVSGHLGIGHTRWATHGEPNQVNAHPHTSHNGKFTLVHNGIIENFSTLRDRLSQRGYSFKSETDTEVLVTLIEDIADHGKSRLC